MAFAPSLDVAGEALLPTAIEPFPRGFAFGHDGRFSLASGIGPNGGGDNTIVAFNSSEVAGPVRRSATRNSALLIRRLHPTGTSSCRASTRLAHPTQRLRCGNTTPGADISFVSSRPAKRLNFVGPGVCALDPMASSIALARMRLFRSTPTAANVWGPGATSPPAWPSIGVFSIAITGANAERQQSQQNSMRRRLTTSQGTGEFL
jgi:hypothetical protein